MNKTRTVTTVFEYDKDGKVIKETRTEYEYEWEPSVQPHQPFYPSNAPGWWQNPVICTTTTNVVDTALDRAAFRTRLDARTRAN
jgi:hypothetical protein